jgi:hypothetical protein
MITEKSLHKYQQTVKSLKHLVDYTVNAWGSTIFSIFHFAVESADNTVERDGGYQLATSKVILITV